MSKIQKKEEEVRNVEGYIDEERRVFVITADPDGVLSNNYVPKKPVENKANNIKEYLKKYRPNI